MDEHNTSKRGEHESGGGVAADLWGYVGVAMIVMVWCLGYAVGEWFGLTLAVQVTLLGVGVWCVWVVWRAWPTLRDRMEADRCYRQWRENQRKGGQ